MFLEAPLLIFEVVHEGLLSVDMFWSIYIYVSIGLILEAAMEGLDRRESLLISVLFTTVIRARCLFGPGCL